MVTQSGGLSKNYADYTWHGLCLIYVYFNDSNLVLAFSLQIRRARDALGLWGPHGAGKAVWVGLWGRSVCAGVTKSADLRSAKWLVWNYEMKNVNIGRLGDVGGVATVSVGMTSKVGPGDGVKTSRLIVSRVILPWPIEFRY